MFVRSIQSSGIVHVFFACTELLQSATVSSVLVEERQQVSECKHGGCGQEVVFSSLREGNSLLESKQRVLRGDSCGKKRLIIQ